MIARLNPRHALSTVCVRVSNHIPFDMRVQSFTIGYLKPPLYRTFSFPEESCWTPSLHPSVHKYIDQDRILSNILLTTFADAYQVTDGTGVTRAECMNEREKDMLFHRVSGSGQVNNGQRRLSLT